MHIDLEKTSASPAIPFRTDTCTKEGKPQTAITLYALSLKSRCSCKHWRLRQVKHVPVLWGWLAASWDHLECDCLNLDLLLRE